MGKRSYKELLKESIIREFDTKHTDVKGPMLANILSYTGDGELPTHQDAASILERFYYGENKDHGVSVLEAPQNEIDEVPADNVEKTKNQIRKTEEITDPFAKALYFDEDECSEEDLIDLINRVCDNLYPYLAELALRGIDMSVKLQEVFERNGPTVSTKSVESNPEFQRLLDNIG